MKPHTDIYNLFARSFTGKWGFETFQDAESQLFYFHFNDENGDAVLYSQGYASAKNRDGGLQSVTANLALEDRYELLGENKHHYFVLKAGNRQQVAHSRFFSSKKELEAARQMLLKAGPHPPVTERTETASTGRETPVLNEPTEPKPANAPRHRFRIDLYMEPRTARIEHVLSETHATMPLLSGEEITAFILANLPPDWRFAFQPYSRAAEEMAVHVGTPSSGSATAETLASLALQTSSKVAQLKARHLAQAATNDQLPDPLGEQQAGQLGVNTLIEQFLSDEQPVPTAVAPADENADEIRVFLRDSATPKPARQEPSQLDNFMTGNAHPVAPRQVRRSLLSPVDEFIFSKQSLQEFAERKNAVQPADSGFLRSAPSGPPVVIVETVTFEQHLGAGFPAGATGQAQAKAPKQVVSFDEFWNNATAKKQAEPIRQPNVGKAPAGQAIPAQGRVVREDVVAKFMFANSSPR